MSTVSAIASSGLMNAATRLASSAAKVADPNSGADLSTEAVKQIEARLDFSANALVLRADSKMTGTLLDMLA